MINSVTQVVLEVEDQERARAFWIDVIGFELAKDETFGDERWVEICPPEGPGVSGPRRPVRPAPVEMHFGWWSMFEDPEGTRYALGELRDDASAQSDDERHVWAHHVGGDVLAARWPNGSCEDAAAVRWRSRRLDFASARRLCLTQDRPTIGASTELWPVEPVGLRRDARVRM